jgi:hypothetical protein
VFNYAAYTVGGFIVGGMIDLEILIGLDGWKLMFLNCGFFIVIGFIFALLIKPERKEVAEATIQ